MIYDHLSNLTSYAPLLPALRSVADYLSTMDAEAFTAGTTELDGGARCIASEFVTAAPEEFTLECHRRFIDVHVTLVGAERIGVRALALCEAAGEYHEDNDYQHVRGTVSLLDMVPGTFAVFFPDDAHIPGLPLGISGEAIRKLVFKLPVAGVS